VSGGRPPIRVVIADDQEVVRAGFAALLETRDDITVVGTARDGRDAITVATTNRPDVILMDVPTPPATSRRRSAPHLA
jgi:YesN/AraC family two-component response regulator